jgi:hypothetical protein
METNPSILSASGSKSRITWVSSVVVIEAGVVDPLASGDASKATVSPGL